MNIIDPIEITAAMLGAGTTLAEDPTAAWAAGTFAVGDERHVVAMHSVYRCAVAGASSVSPELDPTRWKRMRPTNRMAPFDIYASTRATSDTGFTYVVQSLGYFNALALYGLGGVRYELTVRNEPGGTQIFGREGYLTADPLGMWEYLFKPPRPLRNLVFPHIPLRPAAELTLQLFAGPGQPAELGILAAGDLAPFVDVSAKWGGLEHGATAEPVTYSYIKTEEDGTTNIVRRHAATNLSGNVKMPAHVADMALERMQAVLDRPVAWIGSLSPTRAGLNTFGLGSGTVKYSAGVADFPFTVKGLV